MRPGGRRRALALAAALLGCWAEGQRSPEETVAAFVVAMEQSRGDLSQRRVAYQYLSQRSRQALLDRSRRASQVSGGVEFQPWEMLAPGRWRSRLQVAGGSYTARVDGDRAVVTVRGREGGAADVPLVREQGRWAIALELPPAEARGP
ncbi:MAG: hypothetical protein HY909_27045 [Deltaproteobacteria bacterium]|nr:hypothetical protein [Deltaproteobacteria bacterium]